MSSMFRYRQTAAGHMNTVDDGGESVPAGADVMLGSTWRYLSRSLREPFRCSFFHLDLDVGKHDGGDNGGFEHDEVDETHLVRAPSPASHFHSSSNSGTIRPSALPPILNSRVVILNLELVWRRYRNRRSVAQTTSCGRTSPLCRQFPLSEVDARERAAHARTRMEG